MREVGEVGSPRSDKMYLKCVSSLGVTESRKHAHQTTIYPTKSPDSVDQKMPFPVIKLGLADNGYMYIYCLWKSMV